MGGDRPFAALRVLDLSTEIAGPYATKLLCDLGADVLKVEEASGDPLRRRTAAHVGLPEDADSALFQFLNAGKHAALCGADDASRARLRELAREADVVVESIGLAMLGAEVIKVESIQRPDGIRFVGEVLAGELGFEQELARWESEGIIGTQPAWLRAPAARGEKT